MYKAQIIRTKNNNMHKLSFTKIYITSIQFFYYFAFQTLNTFDMKFRKFALLLTMSLAIVISSCKKDEDNDDTNNPDPNNPPTASFTISPVMGSTNTQFTFDASASSDDNDAITDLEFRWDYNGDGTWNTQYTNSSQSNYQYSAEGTFDAKLEVKDKEGLTGTTTKQITISNSANLPPDPPSNPVPADGAIDQAISINLSWTCLDPNQDPLTYDVYLGTTNPPSTQVATGLITENYTPSQLQQGTQYFWRIVAFDDQGLSTVSAVWSFTTETGSSFTCGDQFTDPRDGSIYNTVLIGQQCWMATNMNIGTMINGTLEQTDNGTIEKYCYDNNTSNCATYGGLYQWNELMQYTTNEGAQGICPSGWHVASDPEWMQLESDIGMPTNQVTAMGMRGTNEGAILQVGGSSGFDAKLGGYRTNGGSFSNLQTYGTFATSTQTGSSLAMTRYLFSANTQILREAYGKTQGYSVRCIKD